MTTFTDEEFKGYTFECESASANTGFKHICKVFDKDNTEIEKAKSVINWGNRTWESYQYQSVFESSKNSLRNILQGIQEPEIDFDFLNRLANDGYITDYGDMEDGTTVILMDSWSQVNGEDEREYIQGQGMVKTGKFIKSVYAKLVELAEKKLLKPSVQSTIEHVEYLFTDSYSKCDECGTVHSTEYGDLTWVEEQGMYLCDNCINNSENVEALIQSAKEDVRSALKPTINEDIIRELGYELATDEVFTFAPDRWFAFRTTVDWVQKFINRYDGFVQIYQVEQFDCPFQIWVPKENLDKAKRTVKRTFKY